MYRYAIHPPAEESISEIEVVESFYKNAVVRIPRIAHIFPPLESVAKKIRWHYPHQTQEKVLMCLFSPGGVRTVSSLVLVPRKRSYKTAQKVYGVD